MDSTNQYQTYMKHTKFAAAMAEIKPVAKEATNPHFRSRYADLNTILAEVKPVLHKHGLCIIQPIEEGQVVTRILDSETMELICESALPLSLQGTPQQRGSEITYYRRYTLQSLLALEAEDDDANAATPSAPVQNSKPAPPAGNDADDNKPWINGDNQRWKDAIAWVESEAKAGRGEDAAKRAIATLGKDFKINKEFRAAMDLTGKGLTANPVNANQ
jgi:hypothetical protein